MEVHSDIGALTYAKSVLRLARQNGVVTWGEFDNGREGHITSRQRGKKPLTNRNPSLVFDEAISKVTVGDRYTLLQVEAALEERIRELK